LFFSFGSVAKKDKIIKFQEITQFSKVIFLSADLVNIKARKPRYKITRAKGSNPKRIYYGI